MDYDKQDFFNVINDFGEGNITIDWVAIHNEESKMDILEECIGKIVYAMAFLPSLTETNRQALLGRLAIIHAKLIRAFDDSEQDFIEAGAQLEDLLREVVKLPTWITTAFERFEDYITIEETITGDDDNQMSTQEFDYVNPVILAISIISILMLDEESADEESDR